ncbi:MAG: hypothetical protein ACTHVY_11620, partial [Brevibacterium yomogidense]
DAGALHPASQETAAQHPAFLTADPQDVAARQAATQQTASQQVASQQVAAVPTTHLPVPATHAAAGRDRTHRAARESTRS